MYVMHGVATHLYHAAHRRSALRRRALRFACASAGACYLRARAYYWPRWHYMCCACVVHDIVLCMCCACAVL